MFGCAFLCCTFVFVFTQKTAYDMRISDWSSDVCSSDLKRTAPSTRATSHIGAGRAHSPITNSGSLFAFTKARSSAVGPGRTEERRVGQECVRTCRSRGAQYHHTKQQKLQNRTHK